MIWRLGSSNNHFFSRVSAVRRTISTLWSVIAASSCQTISSTLACMPFYAYSTQCASNLLKCTCMSSMSSLALQYCCSSVHPSQSSGCTKTDPLSFEPPDGRIGDDPGCCQLTQFNQPQSSVPPRVTSPSKMESDLFFVMTSTILSLKRL